MMMLKGLWVEIVYAEEVSNKRFKIIIIFFLGFEVAISKKGTFLSQWKYVLDMLSETDMLCCKPLDSPMDAKFKMLPDHGSF